MKKTIILLCIILLFSTGCKTTTNTPTNKVETFLSNYQNLDPIVLKRLDTELEKEKLTKKQKEKYKVLLKKQYQNLSYKIKNEEINKDKAVVDVEIEVLNYNYSILNSKKYYEEHKDEIKNYNEYMLSELEKVSDKIKYSISFNLTDYDGFWELDEIDNYTIRKIHGLY